MLALVTLLVIAAAVVAGFSCAAFVKAVDAKHDIERKKQMDRMNATLEKAVDKIPDFRLMHRENYRSEAYHVQNVSN